MGTFFNALLGAVASVVLAFLPFSTVIGGAVAGFLEGPNGRNGAIAGALAGLVSLLPIAAFGLFVLGVLGFGLGVFGAPFGGVAAFVFLFGLFATATVVYTVGFSALGGLLGAMLAREFPARRANVRGTMGMRSDAASEYDAGGYEYGRDAAVGPGSGYDADAGADTPSEFDLDPDDELEPESGSESDSRTDRDLEK